MAVIVQTWTWHRSDGSTAVRKVMERPGRFVPLRRHIYEVLTPKHGGAEIITPWTFLPRKQGLARANIWRRHYDRWAGSIQRSA